MGSIHAPLREARAASCLFYFKGWHGLPAYQQPISSHQLCFRDTSYGLCWSQYFSGCNKGQNDAGSDAVRRNGRAETGEASRRSRPHTLHAGFVGIPPAIPTSQCDTSLADSLKPVLGLILWGGICSHRASDDPPSRAGF